MNIMKKCLLFVGLIGIMGAIKTNDNSNLEERVANQVMYKMKEIEWQKRQERNEKIKTAFACIGAYCSAFLIVIGGVLTVNFFQELSKNAATCAANCAKNVAEAAGKNAGDALLTK